MKLLKSNGYAEVVYVLRRISLFFSIAKADE